ncbi:MAG: VWA domain-containing protein [Hyphomicrobium sp.]|nr:VWA domain-containing protein [Hyphomicrobium sp.]
MAFSLLFPAMTHAQQPCTEDAILVFDASKSMAAAAGDNTGLRRIDAVRSALARVLPRVAPKRRLGLIVYGPGSRPACVNVALEFRPLINASERIMARLDELKPDGRTPLTRAVRLAAEVLDFRSRPVTIVLLTDGEETCDGAPCALAKTLKAEGGAHHRARHQLPHRQRHRIGGCVRLALHCRRDGWHLRGHEYGG